MQRKADLSLAIIIANAMLLPLGVAWTPVATELGSPSLDTIGIAGIRSCYITSCSPHSGGTKQSGCVLYPERNMGGDDQLCAATVSHGNPLVGIPTVARGRRWRRNGVDSIYGTGDGYYTHSLGRSYDSVDMRSSFNFAFYIE